MVITFYISSLLLFEQVVCRCSVQGGACSCKKIQNNGSKTNIQKCVKFRVFFFFYNFK